MTDRSNRIGDGTSSVRTPLFVGILVVLAALILANPGKGPAHSSVPTETFLRESVYVTVLALNEELRDTGRLPGDLIGVGMDGEGIEYTPTGDGYILAAEEEGIPVEYRSGEDLEPFRAAFQARLPPFRETP